MLNQYLGTAAITLLFFVSILGWGDLVSRLAGRADETFWKDLAARFVLGCAALYLEFVVLGLFDLLHPFEVIAAILVGVAASCVSLFPLGARAAATFTELMTWERSDQILCGAITALLILQLVVGLTPLVFYDLQAYHLFAPSQWLMAGSVTPTPWNIFANSPLTLQFIVGMSLSLDSTGQVAKLIFTAMGCLLAIGTFELLRPAGRRAALLGTLCVLTFPEFWMMQTLGVVDLAVAVFLLLGLIWLRDAFAQPGRRYAILAGTSFGIAIGSRYQAVILLSLIVAASAVEAMWKHPRERMAPVFMKLAAIGCLSLVLLMPWLVRNYVNLGNPVFPLMQATFGNGGEWSEAQAKVLNADVLGKSIREVTPLQLLIAPANALTDPAATGLFGAGLLLGGLLGLASSSRELRIVSLLGLAGLLVWCLFRPEGGFPFLRFNALSVVFLLAATGAVLGTRITAVLAAGSFAIAVFHVQNILPAAQSLTNRNFREAMYRNSVPSWPAFDFINKSLKVNRILLVGETRGFWLKVPALAPSAFNGAQLSGLFGGSNPEGWLRSLSQMGISHLLVRQSEAERLRKQYGYFALSREEEESFQRWLKTLPKVFDDERGTVVLALP